jgi:hypothetical protein
MRDYYVCFLIGFINSKIFHKKFQDVTKAQTSKCLSLCLQSEKPAFLQTS